MTSSASYVLAFESILYGLIITRIIIEWNKLLQNRKAIKHYWAYYLMTISFFLLIALVYRLNDSSFRYELMSNRLGFLLVGVLPPTCFSFTAYQMFPHARVKDLKEFLMENRWFIFIPALVFFAFFTTYSSYVYGFGRVAFLGSILLIVSCIGLAVRRYWALEVLIIVLLLFTIFAYVAPLLR